MTQQSSLPSILAVQCSTSNAYDGSNYGYNTYSYDYDITYYNRLGSVLYSTVDAMWPVEYGSYSTSISYPFGGGYRTAYNTYARPFGTTITSSTASANSFDASFAPNYYYNARTINGALYSTKLPSTGVHTFISLSYTGQMSSKYDNNRFQYIQQSTTRIYYKTQTTGTSYLTRSSTSATSYLTRSSTSRTEYKTRASTSGYSGVSSSSSQSSGWL